MDMMQMAPFIGIGVFVMMMIIIVPLVLRSVRKKQTQVKNFYPELAQKTGLRIDYDKLVGNYKGYQVMLQYALLERNRIHQRYGSNRRIYRALHVEVMSDIPFPQLAIYDPPGIFSIGLDDILSSATPKWDKLNIDGDLLKKGVNLYGEEFAAEKVINSQELIKLLSTWKCPDIRMEGNRLKLFFDESRSPSTNMDTHSFAIQALDITVAAANAVSRN